MKFTLYLLFSLILVSSVSACSIYTEKQIFLNEKIRFKIKTNKLTEYWVEDLNGNIVKNKRNTSNSNWKTFTPKSDPIKTYKIKTSSCNISKSTIEKLVVYITNSTSNTKKKGLDYYLRYVPFEIYSRQEFPILIDFINKYNKSVEISVWSYVYRSSKCYSGDRKQNMQNITLKQKSSQSMELKNTVNAKPGNYSLRIGIRTNNQTEFIKKHLLVKTKPYLDLCYLRFDQMKNNLAICILNKGYDNTTLIIESPLEHYKETIYLQKGENLIDKNIKLQEGKNPIFVQLVNNGKFILIKEIIVNKKSKDKRPFNLVNGDIVLNNSKTVFKGSNQKSINYLPWLILFLSLIINYRNFLNIFENN